MEYIQNEQLKLAADFVQLTNQNIFLTGKAGTGKTTFLQYLKQQTPKRVVIVAPTGVAAINAGGVTIHSFFQLSFAPAIPASVRGPSANAYTEGYKRKFSREKIRLIKCIDLLVIDEISMVRADVLDSIDEVLRKYRNRSKPFGGVQLLMIGDLHQLSPVIKENEWDILKDYYSSIYFFDSLVLIKHPPVPIELKEIFRQSDSYFIELLNKVRDNSIDTKTIAEINTRYQFGFSPDDKEGYIHLTTHNSFAAEMNQNRMNKLPAESVFFKAKISGDFTDFPNEENLELKVGAQVMFIRNDTFAERRYYNGKIGRITRMGEGVVFVKCSGENHEITVNYCDWENVKYTLQEESKEIKEDVIGTFSQMPLKAAWAITIHKSQGLTFDKVIIDANAAFAFGQVYVALSRCRTFEGIVLSSPISISGIKTDGLILHYANENRSNEGDPNKLMQAKKTFQQELFLELFDFSLMKYGFDILNKECESNKNSIDSSSVNALAENRNSFYVQVLDVAAKFKIQLQQLMNTEAMPENDIILMERIQKASAYFYAKIAESLSVSMNSLFFESDNKAIKKMLADSMEKLQKEIYSKQCCLAYTRSNFATNDFLRIRNDAELDFRPPSKPKSTATKVSKDIEHPELYEEIRHWRNQLAEENNVPVYHILPQKTIVEIARKLPRTFTELKAIKGMGSVKVKHFGDDLLGFVNEFCNCYGIVPEQVEVPVKVKKEQVEKGSSKKLSLDLFKHGKTIDEIARERQMSKGTIEGHLCGFISVGKLKLNQLLSDEKSDKVLAYIRAHPSDNLTQIKEAMGYDISYSEIRFVQQHLIWLNH